MKIQERIQFRAVYYLESQNPRMNPIAIRPEMTPPDYAAWEDTSNGRILRFSKLLVDGQEIERQPEGLPKIIEITGNDGEIYKLVKLTLAIFNEKLRTQVASGEFLKFKNDEEVQEHYLTTDFYGI